MGNVANDLKGLLINVDAHRTRYANQLILCKRINCIMFEPFACTPPYTLHMAEWLLTHYACFVIDSFY